MLDVAADIDDYIAGFPAEVQEVLTGIREAIHASVPGAGEAIAYQMPTVTYGGQSLVHFAGWKKHIGLYPLPHLPEELTAEVAPYATGKGTAKFPLDQPIPYALIGRLAALLVEQRDP